MTNRLSIDDDVEIRNLYALYNLRIDSGEAEAWADCWTPSGWFDARPHAEARGREELVAFASEWHDRSGGRGRHLVANIYVEGAEDRATGRAYLLYLITDETPGSPPAPAGAAVYADELLRHAGAWRFAKRTVTA